MDRLSRLQQYSRLPETTRRTFLSLIVTLLSVASSKNAAADDDDYDWGSDFTTGSGDASIGGGSNSSSVSATYVNTNMQNSLSFLNTENSCSALPVLDNPVASSAYVDPLIRALSLTNNQVQLLQDPYSVFKVDSTSSSTDSAHDAPPDAPNMKLTFLNGLLVVEPFFLIGGGPNRWTLEYDPFTNTNESSSVYTTSNLPKIETEFGEYGLYLTNSPGSRVGYSAAGIYGSVWGSSSAVEGFAQTETSSGVPNFQMGIASQPVAFGVGFAAGPRYDPEVALSSFQDLTDILYFSLSQQMLVPP